MKKSMVAGSIAGIGTAMMIMAGMRTQGFDWNDVCFIVGSICMTLGGVHLAQILEEMLNEHEESNEDSNYNQSDSVVRPFNLSGDTGRRGA